MSTQEEDDARRRGTSESQAQSGEAASAHPSTQEQTSSVAAPAVSATDERLEAAVGYRYWKLQEGKLYSFQAHTSWPVDMALEAEHKSSGLVTVVHWAAVAIAVGGGLLFGEELGRAIRDALDWVGALYLMLYFGVCGILLFRSYQLMQQYWGTAVQTGANTPGIYAMHDPDMVGIWLIAHTTGKITVRGSVYLWGDTIEHEHGVKGQYGYPREITDVACFLCGCWIPLEDYVDEHGPPLHAHCPYPNSSWGYIRMAVNHARLVKLKDWTPAGLAQLRESAPHWFRETS